MKLKQIAVRVLLAAALGAATTISWAIPVFDPLNYAQNYISAIASVKTEVSAANQLIQQAKSAVALAKSTASFKDLGRLSDIQNSIRLYNDLKNVDSRLDVDIQQSQAMSQDLRAQMGASNFSWDKFVASRNAMDDSQRQNSLARYRAVNSSLEATTQRRQEIVNQLGQVQGQTEAMQTLGAALDVIIGQNQQIIAAMAATNRANDLKEERKALSSQAADNAADAYQQRLRDAANKY
jgi:hypothetical protein